MSDEWKKTYRRLFKINNPNLIKRTILKLKNLAQKIKTKIKNRFDLIHKLALLQADFNILNNDKLELEANWFESESKIDKLKEQLIVKDLKLIALKKVLTEKFKEKIEQKLIEK